MKRLLTATLIAGLIGSSALAIKIENLPYMGDFHLGIVNGPGLGINLGVDGGIHYNDLDIGLEIYQIMTDANYSATISATRFGAIIGLRLSPNLKVNGHYGYFNFVPNRDIVFKDMSGTNQLVSENQNYKGDYTAVSLDYFIWDLIFSPKYVLNRINEKGLLSEIDLNIGKPF
ncbi:MAG: hypothetical protein WC645_07700 [Candidatus Margulisiibacteriota bacterium]